MILDGGDSWDANDQSEGSPGASFSGATAERTKVLMEEAAKVRLLIEYLSSFSTARACEPRRQEPTAALTEKDQSESVRKIEDDLSDPTKLAMRTTRIAYGGSVPQNFTADIAFLARARHCLNNLARPANAVTIAFTAMVIGLRHGETEEGIPNVAVQAYPILRGEAERLHKSIRLFVWALIILLPITVMLSAYTAWGKVMLNILDTVRHDAGPVQSELTLQNPDKHPGALCTKTDANATTPLPVDCDQWDDIRQRFAVTDYNIAKWGFWAYWMRPVDAKGNDIKGYEGEWFPPDQRWTVQWATGFVSVMGDYLLPTLYGILGSIAFVLRRFHNALGLFLLTPRDRFGNRIRWVLGAVIGSSIGLLYVGSSAAQTTGILGAAATLSIAALSFLAGYGVEGVFKALDTLVVHIFGVDGISPQQAPK